MAEAFAGLLSSSLYVFNALSTQQHLLLVYPLFCLGLMNEIRTCTFMMIVWLCWLCLEVVDTKD